MGRTKYRIEVNLCRIEAVGLIGGDDMNEVTVESIMTTLLEINESLKSIALSLELVTHQKREAKLYFDAMKPSDTIFATPCK